MKLIMLIMSIIILGIAEMLNLFLEGILFLVKIIKKIIKGDIDDEN